MSTAIGVQAVLGVAILAVVAGVRLSALELNVGAADIDRALKLARTSEAERGRFHAAYQVPVSEPLVEKLEVITEYRRMVLLAEERLAAGDWVFTAGIRAAEEALRPWKQKLTVRARLRFPPMKVYAAVPAISVVVGERQELLIPTRVTNDPQYALGTNPTGSNPMIGVVVESHFDATAVGQRTLPVIVRGPETVDVRRMVDFSTLK